MDERVIKGNTLWLYGPSNALKNLIDNSINESARFLANNKDFDEKTSFPLNDATGKKIILINEPDIDKRHIELVNNVMESQDININVKNQNDVSLPRIQIDRRL